MKIILIVIGVFIAFHLLKFFIYYRKNMNKDKALLQNKPLKEYIPIFINKLNDYSFNGYGIVREIKKNEVQLYLQNSPQIINICLLGGTGYLEWRYKTSSTGECIFKQEISHITEATPEGQRKTAELMINLFEEKLEKFKHSKSF